MEIFLDVDGVLADFAEGIIEHFDLKGVTVESFQMWDSIYGYTRYTPREFWEKTDASFWAGLQFTSEARRILAMVDPFRPVLLSMVPLSNKAEVVKGKVEWIQKNLPQYYNEGRFLVGGTKHQLAGTGKLLIDDSQANCDDWIKHRGQAILVPRPWNKHRGMSVLHQIRWKLDSFITRWT